MARYTTHDSSTTIQFQCSSRCYKWLYKIKGNATRTGFFDRDFGIIAARYQCRHRVVVLVDEGSQQLLSVPERHDDRQITADGFLDVVGLGNEPVCLVNRVQGTTRHDSSAALETGSAQNSLSDLPNSHRHQMSPRSAARYEVSEGIVSLVSPALPDRPQD